MHVFLSLCLYVQVLINQLKEVAPGIQKSISECTEKVNNISLSLPSVTKHPVRSMSSPMQAQTSGRTSVIFNKLFVTSKVIQSAEQCFLCFL